MKKPAPYRRPDATFIRGACAVIGCAFTALGASLSENEALGRLSVWMDGHPVMGCVAKRDIASTAIFPGGDNTREDDNTNTYGVYVVTFSPDGYAVLNSDDRLPLVIAFSASSSVNLADSPDNAFRSFLLSYVKATAATLGEMAATTPPDLSYRRLASRASAGVEKYGPYLKTSWDQCHPYNLFCPDDPGGSATHGYRVPTGCTPAAYAQVLHYHRWPLHGQGTYTFTDSSGAITGTHSVCFGTPFNWAAMQTSYEPWSTFQPGQVEVADLMYRLGVAADADYESFGTAASIETLGKRLATYFYYEPIGFAWSQAALLPDLAGSLRAGYPAVIAIPNHAVVADGLLDDGGIVSYHINYGWGGYNNGWWPASGVPGGAIEYGCTSLKPMLMALPTADAIQALDDEPVTLEWRLPAIREQEVQSIRIERLAPHSTTWSSTAETFDHAVSSGWELSPDGRSGLCWYAGPTGGKTLTLTDFFVPDASSQLTFWTRHRLLYTAFQVKVSSDGGKTYSTLFEWKKKTVTEWQSHTVDLGAFAGEQIQIRFELTDGAYYITGGGVWIDDLSITSSTWLRWSLFAGDSTLAARRFTEQRTVFDNCADFSNLETILMSDGKDWVVSTNDGVDHCFYKPSGGHGEYHLTTRTPVTPGPGTRLLMRWKRMFADDRLRLMVSQDRSNFAEIWREGGSSDWVEQAIPLDAYAGQPIYLRLEYLYESGSFYYNGGVWIDTLWLQEVLNPELEGQPVHFTPIETPLEAGSYTLAAIVQDTNSICHMRSPPFTLTIRPRYEHRPDPGGGITLTGYNGSSERLEIPSEWEGRPITGIASNAFADTPVFSVILPASITTIEAGAFDGADALQRLFFTGDAPSVATDALANSAATVYYLPGMEGWSSSLGGRPALLWNPAPAPGAEIGFQDGVFGFTLAGTASIPVHVQAVSDLTAAWSSLTNTAIDATGTLHVRDPQSPSHTQRFYRCVWP
ncbi:MAG: C10 family peptidase [Kiritimatiellia bacterium]